MDGKTVAAILEKVRRERPLVHHLTNYVTMGDCAAVTSSAGAVPVMAQAEEEVEEMVAASRAAVINTGTISPERVRAMLRMGMKAREKGIPLILDPLGAGATAYRTREILSLLEKITPPVIKGNRAEISFLSGIKDVAIKGIEAQDRGGDGDPLPALEQLRANLGYDAVVAATGPVDVVWDGRRTSRIYNGHALLPLVVGSGCMAASVVAAFAAVEEDYFAATTAALATLGVAAETAVESWGDKPLGPAAFKNQWLDALYYLSTAELERKTKIRLTAQNSGYRSQNPE